VLPYPVRDVFGADVALDRARRGNDATPVRVLFIGGDFPRKGGDALLAAWRDANFGAAASLDLVTDWPVAADNLPAGVTVVRGVTPYSQRWIDLWRAADVFVMPSAHEAFGIVYEEAAAAGVPAVGTAINAVPEIIVDGETGLLVPPRDPKALGAALRALLADPQAVADLGAAGRRRVLSRYTWTKVAASTAAAYREAIAGREGGAAASGGPMTASREARTGVR
jgi:glycosyltransferase involved in cell wall biosynthesis